MDKIVVKNECDANIRIYIRVYIAGAWYLLEKSAGNKWQTDAYQNCPH